MKLGIIARAEDRGLGIQSGGNRVGGMLPEAFWRKVEKSDDCWLWTGHTENGYGRYGRGPGTRQAHRLAWEEAHGPVPEGLELDHLCRVRACVRPEHLEPVPHRTNVLRGDGRAAHQARSTACIRGHEFTPENTYERNGKRKCKACRRVRGD